MHDINNLILLIANTLNANRDSINANSRLEDIQHWDSLSALRIMNVIENTLARKIPLYAFLQISTVQELHELIQAPSNT